MFATLELSASYVNMDIKANIEPDFNSDNVSKMAIARLESESLKQSDKFITHLFSAVKKNLSVGYVIFRIKFQGKRYYPELSKKDMTRILKERGFNDVEFTAGHDVDCNDPCSSKSGCNKWLHLEWNINRKRKR